ncbi:MAG: protein-L-isoaspartate(D-aspartate) O-methyltransferase [candidate division WOR-3 bacterium]
MKKKEILYFEEYKEKREKMVKEQIIARGVKNERVIEAMLKIPRHIFVPKEKEDEAYEDYPLPIGFNQTISQPYMVAVMTEYLEPKEDDAVLEIGTGSGYQTAILSYLVKKVYTIERECELLERAKKTLEILGFDNIKYKCGDGSKGWREYAPYDKIIVTAAAPSIPPPLIEELKNNGIIVIPVGSRWIQELIVAKKDDKGKIKIEKKFECAFVPLVGEYGFKSGE